ncbi:MAG: glycosyltransferase [Lachnospiraceae bacterium]|nr:glycosyltransferase [Lachnospiraceae bacterium]
MNDELISVIVPIYNVEKYLDVCLESIINQTYSNLEIILVDDGSTDNSLYICNEYAQKDKRIKVIHKKNGGLSSARNVGIDVAKGKYIGFVDGDDYIHKELYRRLVDACQRYRVAISICHAVVFQDGKEPIQTSGYIKNDYVTDDMKLIFSNTLNMSQSVCNKLFLRELFSNLIFPEGRVVEDGYILYDLLYKAKKVAYVAIGGYYYRRRPDSIMSRKFRKQDADFVYCAMRTYCRTKKLYPELWEAAVGRAIHGGFELVVAKIRNLSRWEWAKYYFEFVKMSNALKFLEADLLKSTIVKEETKKMVCLFIKNPLEFLRQLKHDETTFQNEKSNRQLMYDSLVEMWQEKDDKRLFDYLIDNGMQKIAIYGMGTMGELLYQKLKNTDIKIECFVDRFAGNYVQGFEDIPVIYPQRILDMVTATVMIVTPIHVFEDIIDDLHTKGYTGTIISLKTVIEQM